MIDESEVEYVECPFCVEPIHPEATVCKHCGRAMNSAVAGIPAWQIKAIILIAVLVVAWLLTSHQIDEANSDAACEAVRSVSLTSIC